MTHRYTYTFNCADRMILRYPFMLRFDMAQDLLEIAVNVCFTGLKNPLQTQRNVCGVSDFTQERAV